LTVTLITGGARSGKSGHAQQLALEAACPVLFVATAEPGDEEMRRRIEAHRRSRPGDWQTLEATRNVGAAIRGHAGEARCVIIDCITLLVNNVIMQQMDGNSEGMDAQLIEEMVLDEVDGLLDCFRSVPAEYLVVTNEVGLGLVPYNELGRLYRDVLGKMNQMLAKYADEVYFMVAGIPVPVKKR
jgi:adenosylcobinamide kinase/adenosylcobinamide-phosphate guanylyltransferase